MSKRLSRYLNYDERQHQNHLDAITGCSKQGVRPLKVSGLQSDGAAGEANAPVALRYLVILTNMSVRNLMRW